MFLNKINGWVVKCHISSSNQETSIFKEENIQMVYFI